MYVQKIHQFLSSIKKTHRKQNWFLFSASRYIIAIKRYRYIGPIVEEFVPARSRIFWRLCLESRRQRAGHRLRARRQWFHTASGPSCTCTKPSSYMAKLCRVICHPYIGGSVAQWLACWTQAQKGLGSNRCWVTALGKLFTPILPVFTKQQN